MTYKTHIISSITVAEVFYSMALYANLITFDLTFLGIFLTAVIFGSLFPDIDEPHSKISQLMPSFISNTINRIFGHRGFTHNILGLSIIPILFGILFFYSTKEFYIALSTGFFIGYISHILGDLVTYAGIQSFFIIDNGKLKLVKNGFLVGSEQEGYVYSFFLLIQISLISYLIYNF